MSNYIAKHPAAFINAIADEGTKEEAIEWLQKIWDELWEAEQALRKIQMDGVELSQEKVVNQRDYFQKLATKYFDKST